MEQPLLKKDNDDDKREQALNIQLFLNDAYPLFNLQPIIRGK
jgi:hypothetical protein